MQPSNVVMKISHIRNVRMTIKIGILEGSA